MKKYKFQVLWDGCDLHNGKPVKFKNIKELLNWVHREYNVDHIKKGIEDDETVTYEGYEGFNGGEVFIEIEKVG